MRETKPLWTLNKLLQHFLLEWNDYAPKLSGNKIYLSQGIGLRMEFILGKYAPEDKIYIIGSFYFGEGEGPLLLSPNDLVTMHRKPTAKLFSGQRHRQYSLEIGKTEEWEGSQLQRDAQTFLKEFITATTEISTTIEYFTETLPPRIASAGRAVEEQLGTTVGALYLTGLKIALELGTEKDVKRIENIIRVHYKKDPDEYNKIIHHLVRTNYLQEDILREVLGS